MAVASKNHLEEDIAELQSLLNGDKVVIHSARIRECLEIKLKHCQLEMSHIPQISQDPASMEHREPVNKTEYTLISTFGWEDEGYGKDKVSVYIMSGIDGVGDLSKENVTCEFTSSSFDLKILDLNGKNFRLLKNHLEKDIVPSKSTYRIKKNRITLTLWKEDNKQTWPNLCKKNPLQEASKPKSGNPEDPSAGLMDMMKKMYDEGDPEMKRTIAKAWTESRNKAPGSSPDMPDMGMGM